MFIPLAVSPSDLLTDPRVLAIIAVSVPALLFLADRLIRWTRRRAYRRGRRGSARLVAHPREEVCTSGADTATGGDEDGAGSRDQEDDDACVAEHHELIPTGRAYRVPAGGRHERTSEYGFKCRLCGYRTMILADQLDERQKAALQVLGLNLRVRTRRRRRRSKRPS